MNLSKEELDKLGFIVIRNGSLEFINFTDDNDNFCSLQHSNDQELWLRIGITAVCLTRAMVERITQEMNNWLITG
jgi:hypothetical protein